MTRISVMFAAALAVALPAGARAESEAAQPGISIQGEIGAGQMVRDLKTDTDLVYGAILGFHFTGPLGLELEYQHAENDLSDIPGSPALKQDGLLGHVRLDFGHGTVTPFIYAGVGWVRYKSNAAIFNGTEDRAVIPAGAGLEFQVKPLVIGVRGEYQWLTEKIAGNTADYWKAVATLGFRIP